MNFHAPNWHSSDGKAARAALAKLLGRSGIWCLTSPGTTGAESLWNCGCAEKNVLVVRVPLVLTKHLLCMASYCQVVISLNFITSAEAKCLGQEFLKRKHWRLWGSHINSCWIHESSGYEGSWLGEKGEHSNPGGRYSSSWLSFDKWRKNYAPARGNDGDPECRITVINK